MKSKRKQRIKKKHKQKRKRKLFICIFFITIFVCSIFIYGQNCFYAIKTFLYKNQASNINIQIEKNDDLDNLNVNFKNEGSCDVYIRGFVFVYPKCDTNSNTVISNNSVKINYGDKDLWYVGEDNYVYYTKPLKIGDCTEKSMAESIKIQLTDEDKRLLGQSELAADIVVEAVQVNNYAYKYQWDMNNVYLEDLFNDTNEENRLESDKVINLNFE